jgi:hypothetical protein
MSKRVVKSFGVAVAIAVGILSALAPGEVAGQGAAAGQQAAATSPVPRTSWGDPDLQGIWDSTFRDWGSTFERPAKFAGKVELTEAEIAELEQMAAAEAGVEPTPRKGDVGVYNRWWTDSGRQTRQTSQVVDPPDGRLPPLTPAGEQARKSRLRGGEFRDKGFDSWEDLHLWERCITKGGMPNIMFPRGYNNNTQIVQAPGLVTLYHEMIHEVRIIPLDGRPHIPGSVRQWVGDGRGHWEGDTLVVETTNMEPRVSALQPWANYTSRDGSGERLRTVERFTRLDNDTIAYQITVEDPEMYTRPWTVALPMARLDDFIYEYACHEGNYTMPTVLRGERMAEQEALRTGKPIERREGTAVGPPE